MIDLRPDHLETVRGILGEIVPDCEVRAFGSRVAWTAKDHSDLDLALVGREAIDWRLVARVKEAFEESDLPFRVDVLDWHAISPSFQKVIEKKFEVVQEGKKNSFGITDEWGKTTLGEFVTLQRGHDLTDPDRRPGTVPVMGSAGQNGFHDTAMAKGPGIVIGRSGSSFGQVHYCDSDYWPHNTALYVTDFHGNDPRFAYYFLKALDFSYYNSGSAQPSLNRNFIYPIEIQIPAPPKQRAIAHILGTLDEKIELNRRMNETLEAMARAIFNDRFVESDADGWKMGPLSEEITLISGGTPKTSNSNYWGGDIPWFSVVDAPSSTDLWVIETEKRITQAGLENSAANLLEPRTTIISARGTVGKCALVGVPMAMNQSCYGIQPRPGRGALYTFFRVRHQVADLQQHAHGSVFDTITRQTFDGLLGLIPPDALTVKFDEMVQPLLDRILLNLQEARTLASLRDALLPKLLSGELRVK